MKIKEFIRIIAAIVTGWAVFLHTSHIGVFYSDAECETIGRLTHRGFPIPWLYTAPGLAFGRSVLWPLPFNLLFWVVICCIVYGIRTRRRILKCALVASMPIVFLVIGELFASFSNNEILDSSEAYDYYAKTFPSFQPVLSEHEMLAALEEYDGNSFALVTNLWFQGYKGDVLAIANQRLLKNTNDLAGLILKAEYSLEFLDIATISNNLYAVMAEASNAKEGSFREKFSMSQMNVERLIEIHPRARGHLVLPSKHTHMNMERYLKLLHDDGLF